MIKEMFENKNIRILAKVCIILISICIYWCLIPFLVNNVGVFILGVIFVSIVIYFLTKNVNSLFILLLVLKPLIDLSWKRDFIVIFNKGLNLQGIIAITLPFAFIFLILLKKRNNFVFSKEITLFLLSITFSSVVFGSTGWALITYFRFIGGIVFFVLVGKILNDEYKIVKFMYYVIMIMYVPIILSFLQLLGILPYEYWDVVSYLGYVGRATATYKHPADLIRILIFSNVFALFLINYYKGSKIKMSIVNIFIILELIVLYFTYHRTGILIIISQILIWFYLNKRVKILFLISIFGCLVGVIYWDNIYSLLFNNLLMNPFTQSDDFLRGRGQHWGYYFTAYSQLPFYKQLFGAGTDFIEFVRNNEIITTDEPHSDLLRIFYTYGVIGFLLYFNMLLYFYNCTQKLRKLAIKARNVFHLKLANLYLIILVSLILFSVTTQPTTYPTFVWYFFSMSSIIVYQYRILVKREADLNAKIE